MKKEFEKKGKVTSIRLTKEELIKFTETAEKEGLTLGGYLRECARHRNNKVDPYLLVHMQNVANIAMELIRRYEPQNVKTAEKLESEMKELWNKLN